MSSVSTITPQTALVATITQATVNLFDPYSYTHETISRVASAASLSAAEHHLGIRASHEAIFADHAHLEPAFPDGISLKRTVRYDDLPSFFKSGISDRTTQGAVTGTLTIQEDQVAGVSWMGGMHYAPIPIYSSQGLRAPPPSPAPVTRRPTYETLFVSDEIVAPIGAEVNLIRTVHDRISALEVDEEGHAVPAYAAIEGGEVLPRPQPQARGSIDSVGSNGSGQAEFYLAGEHAKDMVTFGAGRRAEKTKAWTVATGRGTPGRSGSLGSSSSSSSIATVAGEAAATGAREVQTPPAVEEAEEVDAALQQ